MHEHGLTSEGFGRVAVADGGTPRRTRRRQEWPTTRQMMPSFFRDSLTGLPEMVTCVRQLWESTGLAPDDIQTAMLYDHFTPRVLQRLEKFGFCGREDAKDFLRDASF